MCDTPGFPLTSVPKLVCDMQGFDRLELPQNNRRVVASSKWLLQSWRANSDLQPLLYEGDPFYPSPEEIARVTDYIVAYCCKGHECIVEKMKQIKAQFSLNYLVAIPILRSVTEILSQIHLIFLIICISIMVRGLPRPILTMTV